MACAMLCSPALSAQQNRESLEKRRTTLTKQLKATAQLLGETRNDRKAALDELLVLEAQMEQRRELIEILGQETQLLENTIANHGNAVVALERDLAKAREDCAKLVRAAWRQRAQINPYLRLFNAPNLRELWLRWRLLHRYFTYRSRQFAFLKNTKQTLTEKVAELNLRQQEYTQRLAELQSQKNTLSQEVNEKTGLVKKLKREEQRLSQEAKDLEASREKVSAMIEETIRAEIARTKERARQAAQEAREKAERQKNKKKGAKRIKEAANKPPPTDDELPLTPSETRLSSSFRQNRGKLPWPVDHGVITARFGTYPHPEFPSVQMKNECIRIKTNAGATVYSVFEGTVVRVFALPGAQQVVIVQHGNYFTTYLNLGSVSVQQGQTIGTRAPIGTAYTNGEGLTEVQFELWNNKVKENPEPWLKKK
jgi:septal ring factor EnvC (AmiA/AmiB activator)